MKRKQLPYTLVFISVPIIANLIAVAASFALNNFIFLEIEHERFRAFLMVAPWSLWLVNAVPFPVAGFFALSYLWPLLGELRRFKTQQTLSDRALSRLLNAPLVIGLIVMAGWLLGTATMVALRLYYVENATLRGMLTTVTNSLSLGGITFVFTYYALDYINRTGVIRQYIAGKTLSKIPGVIKPSVLLRFFIFFFSVGALPLLLMGLLLSRAVLASGTEMPTTLVAAPAVMLVVGATLSWLMARAFGRPLVEMKSAVQQIQDGSFEPELMVTSTDELGLLGEGIDHMAASLKEKEFMKETFGKVVAPAIRDHLLGGNIQLGGEMRTATVLFCDLRGFTTLSEQLTPTQIVDMLNVHFNTMSRCIEAEGGLINKFIGDAIMAIYNVPVPQADHAARAFASARQMLKSLGPMNAGFAARGLPPLKLGIGLHTGEVLAGNIGSSSRLEYTVIGDTVNVASRIEGLCKETGRTLLLSEATAAELGHTDALELLGEFPIRGREKLIRIFSGH